MPVPTDDIGVDLVAFRFALELVVANFVVRTSTLAAASTSESVIALLPIDG